MKSLFVPITFLFLMSSCLVFNSGNVSSGPLLNVNDSYIDIATGECKSVAVIGITGMHKKRMILQAKANLFKNRPLQKNEYYANFSVDFTKTFYFGGIVYTSKALISAEVMKTNDTLAAPFSNAFKKLVLRDSLVKYLQPPEPLEKTSQSNGHTLAVGDSVYFSLNGKNYGLYKVASTDHKSIMLLATNNFADKNTLTNSENLFYATKTVFEGFKHGDKVTAQLLDAYNSPFYEDGIVLGIALNNILVETKSGQHALSAFKLKKKS